MAASCLPDQVSISRPGRQMYTPGSIHPGRTRAVAARTKPIKGLHAVPAVNPQGVNQGVQVERVSRHAGLYQPGHSLPATRRRSSTDSAIRRHSRRRAISLALYFCTKGKTSSQRCFPAVMKFTRIYPGTPAGLCRYSFSLNIFGIILLLRGVQSGLLQ